MEVQAPSILIDSNTFTDLISSSIAETIGQTAINGSIIKNLSSICQATPLFSVDS
jgi:hypothetical protein